MNDLTQKIADLISKELQVNDGVAYVTATAITNLPDLKAIQMQAPVKPEIAEEELRNLFRNNSDCYADTWRTENDGSWHEGETIQAMTEDKFIEIIRKQFSV